MKERQWICAKKSCQAVHRYLAEKCQRCGHGVLIECDARLQPLAKKKRKSQAERSGAEK
jgi:hypothetical protein